jgi:hypothetical protein
MAPVNKGDSSYVYGLLIVVALVCIIITLVIMGLQRLDDALAPQIGDIISFKHERSIGPNAQERITARRVGRAPAVRCTLDERVLRASGGSIVIEALQSLPQPTYRVHWAGAHTSDGEADCGAVADLVLSRIEIVALMNAARGLTIDAREEKQTSPWVSATNEPQ